MLMINKESVENKNLLEVVGEIIDRVIYLENLVKGHCIGVNKVNLKIKEIEDLFKTFKVDQKIDENIQMIFKIEKMITDQNVKIKRIDRAFKKEMNSKFKAVLEIFK